MRRSPPQPRQPQQQQQQPHPQTASPPAGPHAPAPPAGPTPCRPPAVPPRPAPGPPAPPPPPRQTEVRYPFGVQNDLGQVILQTPSAAAPKVSRVQGQWVAGVAAYVHERPPAKATATVDTRLTSLARGVAGGNEDWLVCGGITTPPGRPPEPRSGPRWGALGVALGRALGGALWRPGVTKPWPATTRGAVGAAPSAQPVKAVSTVGQLAVQVSLVPWCCNALRNASTTLTE